MNSFAPIGLIEGSKYELDCMSGHTAFTCVIRYHEYSMIQFEFFTPRNPQPKWMQMSAQW